MSKNQLKEFREDGSIQNGRIEIEKPGIAGGNAPDLAMNRY